MVEAAEGGGMKLCKAVVTGDWRLETQTRVLALRQSAEATPTPARALRLSLWSAADGLCWEAGAALRTADGLR